MTSQRSTEILLDISLAPNAGAMPLRLVRACSRALPVTGAGLSLMSAAGALDGLIAASNDTATAVEDLQFDLGEGPCWDASRSGYPVLVADLAHDPDRRWPFFAADALVCGVAAVFSYPLQSGGLRLGVLDLYRDQTGALDDAAHAEALHYAAAAALLLLHLQAQLEEPTAAAGRTIDPVDIEGIALADDRAVVHQATGVVSITAGVGVGAALLLLRGRAYAEERGVGDLAEDIVAGRARLSGPGRTAQDR